MGIFNRIWGKGYNDRISLFLMANALVIVIILPMVFPIPFLENISMIYLAITFLLVSKKYKIFTIAIFEILGMVWIAKLGMHGYVLSAPAFDLLLRWFGLEEVMLSPDYPQILEYLTFLLLRTFAVVTFVGLTMGLLVLFFGMSLLVDRIFKIRKRAGLK